MYVDSTYEMDDGYQLQIAWSGYPEAQVVKDGRMIGKKSWVMTGSLFTHFRIARWARKTVIRHEKMQRNIARPLHIAKEQK